jgi:predicted dienelactone hydrolase
MMIRTIRAPLAVLGLVLACSTDLRAQAMIANIPARLFAVPGGPYAIGTYDFLWVDAARPESYTRDPTDRRKLPVQVWYPTAAQMDSERAPYIHALAEFGASTPLTALEHVRTNATMDAALSNAERKYPIIVYSHGAGWPRFSATFIAEYLASRGYVVFAIEHPGLDQTVLFSDGTSFAQDTLLLPRPAPGESPRITATRSTQALNNVHFPIWIADLRFALDRIAALDTSPGRFRGRLDVERIGMLGWSFGGAAAMEMLRIDPRVKAAVNHDGRLFGGVATEPIGRPFLLFHHGVDDAATAPAFVPEANRQVMRELLAESQSADSTARARATADWYDVTIARTNHGHFSDLSLFLAVFGDTTLLPGRRAHEIISAYTGAFFDRYLKQRASDLLDGARPQFPEVTFRRSAQP